MSKMDLRGGIKIEGHVGTWYVLEDALFSFPDERGVQKLYLLEHETYGDEAACLIVNEDKEVVLDDVWNGFNDLEEAMECGYIE